MAVKFTQKGNFSKFEKYISRSRRIARLKQDAEIIADQCIDELRKATPIYSGLTAESWDYEIEINNRKTRIFFNNRNIQNGVNVALLLEYGHGTPTGGWVEGKEYIDPAIRKVYLDIINDKWKELTRL